jgi:hypothetical protein
MRTCSTVFLPVLAAMVGAPLDFAAAEQTPTQIRESASFSGIADRAERSRAMFAEVAKVLTGPRCMNCHPAGDHPLQGDDHHIHQPAAARGLSNNGVPGLPCASCHTDRNFTLSIGEAKYQSIPGHLDGGWPLSRWHGKVSLSATSAGRSKIQHATGVEVLPCCMTTSQTTTWWGGRGIPGPGGKPLPERRNNWAISYKHGSIPAPSVPETKRYAAESRGEPLPIVNRHRSSENPSNDECLRVMRADATAA